MKAELRLYVAKEKTCVMKKYLFAILAVVCVASGCNRKSADASEAAIGNNPSVTDTAVVDDRGYKVREGDEAPLFEAVDAATGDTIRLADLRGKVVMLQFTASWCGVCRKEMPQIESRIWQRHKNDTTFALLGIDRDEPAEKVARFAEQTGVTYPLVLDPGADIFGLYADKQAGVTRNVIIGRDGRIVMMTRLYEEKEFERMVAVIDSLLVASPVME